MQTLKCLEHCFPVAGLVIPTQPTIHANRITYSVSPLCACACAHGLSSVLFHSWNTTRVTVQISPTLPATDCDLVRYDGLCVYGVLDFGVAFQSMHTTSYWPPGNPLGFKLQSYSAKPCAPPRRTPCTHFSNVLRCSICAELYRKRERERERERQTDRQTDRHRERETERERSL